MDALRTVASSNLTSSEFFFFLSYNIFFHFFIIFKVNRYLTIFINKNLLKQLMKYVSSMDILNLFF